MAKFIFKYDNPEFNREASSIQFEVPEDMNIREFKNICIRMAQSLGYANESITNSFGELDYEEEKRIIPGFGPSVDGNINHGDEIDLDNPNIFNLGGESFGLHELLNELNIKRPNGKSED